MKLCYESVVIGMFLGALMLCILMLVVPKPINCEVVFNYGNGNHRHSHRDRLLNDRRLIF